MYQVPVAIRTERLVLRRFEPIDLEPFTRFLTNPEVTRFLAFPEEAKTVEGARHLLESTILAYDSNTPLFALAVEEVDSGKYVGSCGLNPLLDGEAEIFYAVMPSHWGKGIATEMTKALTEYAFKNLGLRSILAFIVPGHSRSIKVATKVGFQDAGLVENPNFSDKVHQYVLRKLKSCF